MLSQEEAASYQDDIVRRRMDALTTTSAHNPANQNPPVLAIPPGHPASSPQSRPDTAPLGRALPPPPRTPGAQAQGGQ